MVNWILTIIIVKEKYINFLHIKLDPSFCKTGDLENTAINQQ